MVRATGEIHLNSSWDEGMPEEIDHDHLYGLAWNPMTLIEVLKNIDGAATARRVGTDALSPTFDQLLPMAFPNAELVDGELAMRTARRIKTADEVACSPWRARGSPRTGLAAAVSELAPGVTEQALTGAMLEAMAAGGVSTSATQDGAWVTSRDAPVAAGPTQTAASQAGDLVAFASGSLADGYVGEVGRTWPVGDVKGADELYGRSNELWDRLVAACRPGAPAAAICLTAYEAAGEPLPPMPVAHGLGLGFDPPVVSPDLPADVRRGTARSRHWCWP